MFQISGIYTNKLGAKGYAELSDLGNEREIHTYKCTEAKATTSNTGPGSSGCLG